MGLQNQLWLSKRMGLDSELSAHWDNRVLTPGDEESATVTDQLGMAVHAFNPSSQQVEAGKSPSQSASWSEFQDSQCLIEKTKINNK